MYLMEFKYCSCDSSRTRANEVAAGAGIVAERVLESSGLLREPAPTQPTSTATAQSTAPMAEAPRLTHERLNQVRPMSQLPFGKRYRPGWTERAARIDAGCSIKTSIVSRH